MTLPLEVQTRLELVIFSKSISVRKPLDLIAKNQQYSLVECVFGANDEYSSLQLLSVTRCEPLMPL